MPELFPQRLVNSVAVLSACVSDGSGRTLNRWSAPQVLTANCARGIGVTKVNAGSFLLIFQSRLLREREQARHSASAVSIGPLAKTPYLLSSTSNPPLTEI